MTHKELQDAVLGRRFPGASQRENAKRWLRTAYSDVWAAHDWSFKRVSLADVTVLTGGLLSLPTDFGREIGVYTDQGSRLVQVAQDRFEEEFLVSELGTARAFMAVNRQITVAPVSVGATYQLSYERRVAHLESDGTTVSAGFMDEDSDTPLWLEEHHSLLVPRAMVIGLQEINDPSWEPLQDEYERQLDRMRKDLQVTRPAIQWGAASWDA